MEELHCRKLRTSWQPSSPNVSLVGNEPCPMLVPSRKSSVVRLPEDSFLRTHRRHQAALTMAQFFPERLYFRASRNGRRNPSRNRLLLTLLRACQSSSVGDKESLSR